MIVKNFVWDSKSVSWIFEGRVINKTFENVHFAVFDTQKEVVYVEAGKNYSQDQVYNISFDGKEVFMFDKIVGKICWIYQKKLVQVIRDNIISVQPYNEYGLIIAIVEKCQDNRRLQAFKLDGTMFFEKQPPQGYKFLYLASSNNCHSVVCDGGESKADAYGRSSWHFSIDIKTGNMIKENLAY